MRPAATSASAAATSSRVPPTCTVPARRAGSASPRDATLDGQVDLEGRGAVAVALVGPSHRGGHRVAGDARHGARGDVEQGDACPRQVRAAPRTRTPVSIVPPWARSRLGERVGDGARPALGHRPADVVARRGQHEADRGRGRPRPAAGWRGPRRRRTGPAPRRSATGGRAASPAAAPRARSGPAAPGAGARGGWAASGPRPVVEAAGQRPEGPTPGRRRHRGRAAVSSRERTSTPGATALEGVDEVDLGPAPRQAVLVEGQRGQERRGDPEGVHGRADVVEHTRDGQLLGAGATADGVRRLEDRDLVARPARWRRPRPARSGRTRRPPRRPSGTSSWARYPTVLNSTRGEENGE